MVVTLIGYRGTGKTSVAPPLAARLKFESIDADAELERRAGQTIREIFESEGEPGFRARERELLAELLDRDRLVHCRRRRSHSRPPDAHPDAGGRSGGLAAGDCRDNRAADRRRPGHPRPPPGSDGRRWTSRNRLVAARSRTALPRNGERHGRRRRPHGRRDRRGHLAVGISSSAPPTWSGGQWRSADP